jgi:heme oxygenase
MPERDCATPAERAADTGAVALMARLRSATAGVHAATEDLPLMRALLDPAVTIPDYRRYLEALYGVYLAVEPALYAALPPSLPARLGVQQKLPALRQDLARLGMVPSPLPAGWTSSLRRSIDGPGAALGGLYVLEGATLGGRVIARRLRRALGADAAALPFAFLDGRQREPGAAWRAFGAALEQAAADRGVPPAAVVAGAVAVFEAMHRALAERGTEARTPSSQSKSKSVS